MNFNSRAFAGREHHTNSEDEFEVSDNSEDEFEVSGNAKDEFTSIEIERKERKNVLISIHYNIMFV